MTEGFDVVPAIALGSIRDALLERVEEVGQETAGAVLALPRERAVQERPAPGAHALHIALREHGRILVPVGIVQTEELRALELESGDVPAARLEGSRISSSVRMNTGTTTAATVAAPMRPRGATRRAAGSCRR